MSWPGRRRGCEPRCLARVGNPFDVLGAKACGLRGVWVRRDESRVFDPWEFAPDLVISDLRGLVRKCPGSGIELVPGSSSPRLVYIRMGAQADPISSHRQRGLQTGGLASSLHQAEVRPFHNTQNLRDIAQNALNLGDVLSALVKSLMDVLKSIRVALHRRGDVAERRVGQSQDRGLPGASSIAGSTLTSRVDWSSAACHSGDNISSGVGQIAQNFRIQLAGGQEQTPLFRA